MKYIVVESRVGGTIVQTPIIFPEILVHCMVADAVMGIMPGDDAKVISAGSVNIHALDCGGHSTSIKPNVESRGDKDSMLINGIDYGAGYR